jgi:hypothetical protein
MKMDRLQGTKLDWNVKDTHRLKALSHILVKGRSLSNFTARTRNVEAQSLEKSILGSKCKK